MKTSQEKESKAMDLFNIHYEELCDPDKKSVREALKSKPLFNSQQTKPDSKSPTAKSDISCMGNKLDKPADPPRRTSLEIMNEIKNEKTSKTKKVYDHNGKEKYTERNYRKIYLLQAQKQERLECYKMFVVKLEQEIKERKEISKRLFDEEKIINVGYHSKEWKIPQWILTDTSIGVLEELKPKLQAEINILEGKDGM